MKKEKVIQLKLEISKGKIVQLIDYGSSDGTWGKSVEFHYKNHEIVFTADELWKLSKMFSDFSKCESNPTIEEFDSMIDKRFPEGISQGEKVKAYRSREKLTQAQLAESSGVPQPHISQIEKGERSIGLNLAKKLSSALNCDYRALL